MASSQLPMPTVLASVTNGLADFIRKMGGDSADIFESSELDADSIRPNDPIPLKSYCKVLEQAAFQTRTDNFALWFGQQFEPEALGLLGYLALSSETVKEALECITTEFPHHQQNSHFKLMKADGLCRLEYRVDPATSFNRRHDAELSLGMFTNVIKRAAGHYWSPIEVYFEHTKPMDWKDHREAFGADVLFDRQYNTIIFRESVLSLKMPGFDRMLHTLLLQSLREASSTRGHRPPTLGERVRREIARTLNREYPRIDDVAENLGLTVWTLQRRLADENLNFRDIVDDARRVLSIEFLSQPGLSVSEIAYRLAYADISSFSRAFQRWFSVSPRQWRSDNAAL